MVSVPNWYQIGNKTCYIPKLSILCRKKISMLTGSKVSPLACKCPFYGPKHKAKGALQGTEFWRSWNAKINYTNI